MATFNIASIEAPAKKKVSLKALDKAITQYINDEESTFTIEVGGAKPMEFTFSTFLTPVLRKAYYDQLIEKCISSDSSTGIIAVDSALAELITYWFILERLSNVPLPLLDDGLNGEVATDKVSVYGTYFASISEEFKSLFLILYKQGIAVCEGMAEIARDVASTVLESADISALLQNPELLELIKDRVKAGQ